MKINRRQLITQFIKATLQQIEFARKTQDFWHLTQMTNLYRQLSEMIDKD